MLIGPQPSLNTHQARMNRSTLGQWDWYALHRSRIEQLIVPATPGQTLCVLGAGNCNDLDLDWLTRVYEHVHLVDLDRNSLDSAIDRQFNQNSRRAAVEFTPRRKPWVDSQTSNSPGGAKELSALDGMLSPDDCVPIVNASFHLHAPLDLTSIAPTVAAWKTREVMPGEVDAAIATINQNPIPSALVNLAGQCDLVLSPCILSQIWVAVRDLLGSDHPRWKQIKAALLHQHLRQINALLKPGGRAVKIVDLASTSVVKHLDQAKPHEWPGLMRMCITEGKCFRGLEPDNLKSALRAQSVTTPIQRTPPWLWHLGFAKSFLCYALSWTRA